MPFFCNKPLHPLPLVTTTDISPISPLRRNCKSTVIPTNIQDGAIPASPHSRSPIQTPDLWAPPPPVASKTPGAIYSNAPVPVPGSHTQRQMYAPALPGGPRQVPCGLLLVPAAAVVVVVLPLLSFRLRHVRSGPNMTSLQPVTSARQLLPVQGGDEDEDERADPAQRRGGTQRPMHRGVIRVIRRNPFTFPRQLHYPISLDTSRI